MPRGRNPHPAPHDAPAPVRIDKWLWAARFYKTRSLATAAIDAGHVKVDGQRAKASRELRGGEVIAIVRGDVPIELQVLALSNIRGPAPQARMLYEETESSVARRREVAELRRIAPGEAGGARPTKRDRRHLERLRDDH